MHFFVESVMCSSTGVVSTMHVQVCTLDRCCKHQQAHLRTVCVYAHTHTQCTDGVLGCEPRSRDETPGGPEDSRWTKSRHTYIRICVQSTHVYVYARRRDEILD